MVVGFRLKSRGDPEVYAYAEGSEDGWQAFVGTGEEARAVGQAGTGRALALRFRWAEVGGARRLGWRTTSSWVRPGDDTTHFAFDQVPEVVRHRFPEKRRGQQD